MIDKDNISETDDFCGDKERKLRNLQDMRVKLRDSKDFAEFRELRKEVTKMEKEFKIYENSCQ